MEVVEGTIFRLIDDKDRQLSVVGDICVFSYEYRRDHETFYACNFANTRDSFLRKHEIEFVSNPMTYYPGDKVFYCTSHEGYTGKIFTVLYQIGTTTYRVRCGKLEATANIHDILPISLGNKNNVHILKKESQL